MARFVILQHMMPESSVRDSHLDLMFEANGTLMTWAIPRWPAPDGSVPAERLADHRIDYLTYEGEVSGDRGSVHRWDAGTYSRMDANDSVSVDFCATIIGRVHHGRVTIRTEQDATVVEFVPAD